VRSGGWPAAKSAIGECAEGAGTERERRFVEERNREVVEFWGTVLGVRAVRHLPREVAEEAGEGEDVGGDATEGCEENAEEREEKEQGKEEEAGEEQEMADGENEEVPKVEGSANEDGKKDVGDG
jgi:hypothetical protein